MEICINNFDQATVPQLIKYCFDSGLETMPGYSSAKLAGKEDFIQWIYEAWGEKNSSNWEKQERKYKLVQALDKLGFVPSPYSAEQERRDNQLAGGSKGWDIYFCIPNGGICACVIVKDDCAFQFPVGDTDEDWEFHFDYLDHKGVFAHAKRAIDAIVAIAGMEVVH